MGCTALLAFVLLSATPSPADDAAPLAGTKPLTEGGDLASKMVDGIDRFLLRKIEDASAGRARFWEWDHEGLDGHNAAMEPNRKRLRSILGLRSSGPPRPELEVLSTLERPATI